MDGIINKITTYVIKQPAAVAGIDYPYHRNWADIIRKHKPSALSLDTEELNPLTILPP